MDEPKVNIIIGLNDQFSDRLGGIKSALGGMLQTAGGFLMANIVEKAVGGVVDFGKQVIASGMEAQDAQSQLNTVLANTGSITGVTAAQVQGLADKYSGLTKFSDDTIVSAGAVLARFKEISSDAFPAANMAAMNLAQTMGTSLPSAAQLLGKILEQPGTAMMRLRAAGVEVTPELDKMLKKMAETGDTAGAQKLILDELSKTIGGAAEAAGKTASGGMAIFNNTLDKIKEKIGGAIIPIIGDLSRVLVDWLNSPVIQAGIEALTGGITGLLNAFETGMGESGDILGGITNVLYSLENISPIFTSIGDAINGLILGFQGLSLSGTDLENSGIADFFNTLGAVIKDIFSGDLGVASDDIREGFMGLLPPEVVNAMSDFLLWIRDVGLPALQNFGKWFTDVGWPAIQNFAGQVLSQLIPGLIQLGKWIGDIAVVLLPILSAAFTWLGNNMNIVVPILAAVGAVILALTSPISLVLGGILLLSTAWANNWGGIRDKLTQVWAFVQPVLQTLWTWLQTSIPVAIQTLKTFWENTLLPAIQKVWTWVQTVAFPIIQDLIRWVATNLPAAIQTLMKWWNDLLPIVQNIWGGIQSVVQTVSDAIQTIIKLATDIISGNWYQFGQDLRTQWDAAWAAIQKALTDAWTNIKKAVGDLINNVINFFKTTDWGQVGHDIIQGIVNGINSAVDLIVAAAKGVSKAAVDAIRGFFNMHSPSTVMIEIGQAIAESMAIGISNGTGKIAQAIIDIGEQIKTAASGITGFGSALGTRFNDINLQPLNDKVASLQDELSKMPAGMETSQRYVLLKQQLADATKDQAAAEEKITAYQKTQQDLAFVQSQLDFFKFLKDNKLDARQILSGITLGVNASAGDLLDAMTRAVQAMVDQANKTLQIASPSKVFEKIGQNVMQGLSQGINTSAHLPALATAGVSAGLARNTNIYLTANYPMQEPGSLMDETRLLGALWR